MHDEQIEYVRGDTIRALRVKFKDGGTVLDISGWAARFQGKSADLPGIEIDAVGVIVDGPAGIAEVPEFGNLISAGQLGDKPSATFVGRMQVTNPISKKGYATEMTIVIVAPPI